MKSPFFSIIMPVYNVEKYLDAAIKSILGQTFGNFELILVDDGSTDSSGLIAGRYRDLDRRVVLVHQPNAGLSAARNKGMDLAGGSYICLIDSDDMLAKTAFETIHKLLSENNHPEVLAFSAAPFIDEGSEIENSEAVLKNYRDVYERSYLTDRLYAGTELYREMAIRHNFVPNAVLFVMELTFLKKMNLKFVDGITFEDEVFSRHLFTNADKIFFTNKKLYRRRIRSGSIMQSQVTKHKVLSLITVAEETHALYERKKIPELKDDALRFYNYAADLYEKHFGGDTSVENRLLTSGLMMDAFRKITPTSHGFNMYVPPFGDHKYADTASQPLTAYILSHYILDNSIFVDVAAGPGYFSLVAAEQSKAKKIISLETNLNVFEILSKNINLNRFRNIILHNLTDFMEDDGPVRPDDINALLPENDDSPLFFRINVKGHESAILNGIKQTIRRVFPKVRMLVECDLQVMKQAVYRSESLLDILSELGFDVFLLDESSQAVCKLNLSDPKSYIADSKERTSLLCLPKHTPSSVMFFSHSSSLAGSEKSLHTLISDFPTAGIIATVVLPADGPFRQHLEEIGAMTVVSNFGWWSDREQVGLEESQARLARDFRHIQEELVPLMDRINPDVIVTNTSVIPWGSVCAFLTKKPHVWYVRELGLPEYGINYFYPRERIAEYIKGGSNLILTNSLLTRNNFFGESTLLRTEIVHPTVTVEMDEIANSENYFHQLNGLKLVCVGEIVPGKGQADAIYALRELIQAGANVEIVFAGRFDTEYYMLLLDLIQEFGLASFVQFVGFVKSPYGLYKQADAVLICSRNEAFGRVTLEAMQLGKPIIAASSGGTLELIEDQVDGLLYPPGDATQLAERIKKLIDDPDLRGRLGAAAAEKARQKFTRDAALTKFLRVLREVSGEPNHSSQDYFYWIRDLENVIWQTRLAEKEAQKDVQLAQKDAQLAEIHSSKGWRLVLWLRRVRLLLAPPNSRRARAGQTAFSILKRMMRK